MEKETKTETKKEFKSKLDNLVPDVTLCTAIFDLSKFNAKCLDIKKIESEITALMKIPVYLVIFCDINTYEVIRNTRTKYGLDELTQYEITTLDNLWSFQFLEKVIENRKVYHPTKCERTTPQSHLLVCNKFDFVLQTMEMNPFKTSKFGWIDAFIRPNCEKIGTMYSPNMLPYILNNITDKFHLQILNVVDKKYKLKQNKKEYYSEYRWLMTGCLFTTGIDGKKILNRLKEICKETIDLGFSHAEEMFYLEVLDEYYNDIVRSYGDYHMILNNFITPTIGYDYILKFIIRKYNAMGYFREAYDCCSTLFKEISENKVNVEVSIHFQILLNYYIATMNYKVEECEDLSKYIKKLCELDINIKNEYNKNKDYHDKLFAIK